MFLFPRLNLRQKAKLDPTKTDLQLFEEQQTGDVWNDADFMSICMSRKRLR